MSAFGSLCRKWMEAVAFVAILLFSIQGWGQDAHIFVDASRVMNKISPQIYGSCIEDVNHEIYGGLYDQRLYGESFEEPAPAMNFEGWKTLGGDWQPDGAAVAVSAGPGYMMVREMPVMKDGSVEADVKLKSGFDAGLLLRVSDERKGADNFNGYEVSLNPGAQTIVLGKHLHNWIPLTEKKTAFHANEWVHIKVVLQGPRLLLYANHDRSPIIDYTDKKDILLTGRIALRTYNADAAFQNVVINDGVHVIGNKFKAGDVLNISAAWDAVGAGATDTFLLDTVNAYTGKQSQVIWHKEGSGKLGISNMGLNRWGIAVRKGQQFAGRVYLCAEHLAGPVTLALQSADGSKTYATHEINNVTPEWKKYSFSLTSAATDPKARFVLYIEKRGKLWVDQAVLMSTGADQFKGLPLRADIAAKMQQEGLTFLRYGGTMVNAPAYRWKNMTGDPDKRPPYRGHWYPYSSNGFGIEEFVKYCEAAGFEPAFAINIEETPEDVAAMVEYLTGDTTSYWGSKRAQYGHPQPYKIKYIEIGNEEVINADDAAQYDHYTERFSILYKAIHDKNPAIQLVNAAWWRPDSPNMERVFKALDGKAAYWDLHVDADAADAGTVVDRNLTRMKELFLQWDPHTAMKCAIFEENGGLHNMQRALGHATILNAVRRHGDFLLTSCAANALQPLGQNDNGWDQGQIFFTPSQVWGMPPFYAQQMAAENHQPLRVLDTVQGNLDVTATRSSDGRTLVLHVVNTTSGESHASISLSGFAGHKPVGEAYTLSGDLRAVNTPAHPENIRTKKTTVQLGTDTIVYDFPAYSYTILRLER